MLMPMISRFLLATIWILLIGQTVKLSSAKGSHKVQCTEDMMKVDIGLPIDNTTSTVVYLEGLKGYPDERCQPKINDSLAEFSLSLKDFYECGVTRMINKLTGKKVYYHKIIIEGGGSKEIVNVKCVTTGPTYNVMNHTLSKRDVLPAGFQEPEDLDITMYYEPPYYAPEPILGVGVRQGGEIVTGELNVSPGTPLTMEIYLDKASAPVYGLGVTYMQVTDTKTQEETIIFNGCSVDPYLFDNFNTEDGDYLSAKFKAFKFPESTYVQFRATVNVCLDKCQGTPCSNGQIGYGRRRRREISPSPMPADPNKIYEFSMATFIRVSDVEGVNKNELLEIEEKLRQLKIANQKLARNSRGSTVGSTVKIIEEKNPQIDINNNNNNNSPATVMEEATLIKLITTNSSSSSSSSSKNNRIFIRSSSLALFILLIIGFSFSSRKVLL